MVEELIVGAKYSHTLWALASCMIIFRRRDNLHKVSEGLYFQLIFALLRYLVRRPAARTIYSTVFAIEMYGCMENA